MKQVSWLSLSTENTSSSPTRSGVIVLILLTSSLVSICLAGAPWPAFEATALTGASVHSEALLGEPTLLIVTPSREAAGQTRLWAEALRRRIDADKFRVRSILAIDLPFFMSEQDALPAARDAVPQRYHDQTWLLDSVVLERELGIPRDGDDACVVVLDQQGQIVAQTFGPFSDGRLAEILGALEKLR